MIKCFIIISYIFSYNCWAVESINHNHDGELIYKKAVFAYDTFDSELGDKLMLKAANLGYPLAICKIAKEKRGNGVWETKESLALFKKAADLGEPCGFVPLLFGGISKVSSLMDDGRDTDPQFIELYTKKYNEIINQRILNNDTKAMILFALTTKDIDKGVEMLKKAVHLGDGEAAYILAEWIMDGTYGWYLFDSSKEDEAIKWYTMSANLKYFSAISRLSKILEDRKEYKESLNLLNRGVDLGYSQALFLLAIKYTDTNQFYYKDKDNLEKAVAYFYILMTQNPVMYNPPQFKEDSQIKILYNETKSKLTKDEFNKSIAWANNWMLTHYAHVEWNSTKLF